MGFLKYLIVFVWMKVVEVVSDCCALCVGDYRWSGAVSLRELHHKGSPALLDPS